MGDELVIDGGMACFEVIEKIGSDLRCKCTDPGLFLPRAKLSFWRDGKLVERNNELPTLSTKVDFFYFYFRFHYGYTLNSIPPIRAYKQLKTVFYMLNFMFFSTI